MTTTEPKFVSLTAAAAVLGLPSAWLKREAEAKRVPSVRAGRRRLFNVEAVEAALLQRAAKAESDANG